MQQFCTYGSAREAADNYRPLSLPQPRLLRIWERFVVFPTRVGMVAVVVQGSTAVQNHRFSFIWIIIPG